MLAIGGAVRRPVEIELAELAAAVEPREQRSGLHCVATWSTLDLQWSGLPFAAVYPLLADRVGAGPDVHWLTLTGLDASAAASRSRTRSMSECCSLTG